MQTSTATHLLQEEEEEQETAQVDDTTERQTKFSEPNLNSWQQYDLARAGLPLTGVFSKFSLDTYRQTPNGRFSWFTMRLMGWVTKWYSESLGVADDDEGDDDEFESQTINSLVLQGSYGIGKTGLAIAIARSLMLRLGIKVYYTTVRGFISEVSLAWHEKSGKEYHRIEKMKRVHLLILDDLGAGHANFKDENDSSPAAHLWDILNSRYLDGLPTIITTNCADEADLVRVMGERNYQRLVGHCEFIECRGVNLRVHKSQKKGA